MQDAQNKGSAAAYVPVSRSVTKGLGNTADGCFSTACQCGISGEIIRRSICESRSCSGTLVFL